MANSKIKRKWESRNNPESPWQAQPVADGFLGRKKVIELTRSKYDEFTMYSVHRSVKTKVLSVNVDIKAELGFIDAIRKIVDLSNDYINNKVDLK